MRVRRAQPRTCLRSIIPTGHHRLRLFGMQHTAWGHVGYYLLAQVVCMRYAEQPIAGHRYFMFYFFYTLCLNHYILLLCMSYPEPGPSSGGCNNKEHICFILFQLRACMEVKVLCLVASVKHSDHDHPEGVILGYLKVRKRF